MNRKIVFGVVLVIVVFLVFSFFVDDVGDSSDNLNKGFPVPGSGVDEMIVESEGGLVLQGLGVEFDSYNPETGFAGDFIFSDGVLFDDGHIKNEKPFLEFGEFEHVIGSLDKNIEYWYFLKPGTKVKANVEGRVEVGFLEHTQDWAVSIYPENTQYIVSFEHLSNLEVEDGEFVNVGDVLGDAVVWSANDNVWFTELAVWVGGEEIFKYCPFDFLDEELKDDYGNKINQLANDWEDYLGRDVYAQEEWVSPGCLTHEIQER